jgi:hypothetical protein
VKTWLQRLLSNATCIPLRDGVGARVDAAAARDDVTVEVAAGAEYTQVLSAQPRKDGAGYVARFLRPATAYEVTVVVNGVRTKGSPVWVTVDENADLLKCGGYDSDGNSGVGSGEGSERSEGGEGGEGGSGGGGTRWGKAAAAEDDGTAVEVLPQTGAAADPRFEFKVTKQELIRQKAEAMAARERQGVCALFTTLFCTVKKRFN